MYRSLDSEKIKETSKILCRRIKGMFPVSGLKRVSDELYEVTEESASLCLWVSKPVIWLRICTFFLVATLMVFMLMALHELNIMKIILNFSYELGNFLQATESGINSVVLIGIGIFFLVTLEKRIKRKRILRALNELRSMAHVIDAHQMNKDSNQELPDKELITYLNFCSDMLSILGKLSALYVQRFDDSEALSGVDDIQDLTNGISRKIWQKISVIDRNIEKI